MSVALQHDIKKQECNFSAENRSQRMTLNHTYTSKARIEVFYRKHVCKVQWFPSKNTTVCTSQETACSLSSWQCPLMLHDGLQEVIHWKENVQGSKGNALAANSTALFNATCMGCALEMVLLGYGEDSLSLKPLGVVVRTFWGCSAIVFPQAVGFVPLPQQVPSAEYQGGQCHRALILHHNHLSQLVRPPRPASHPPALPELSPKWHMD